MRGMGREDEDSTLGFVKNSSEPISRKNNDLNRAKRPAGGFINSKSVKKRKGHSKNEGTGFPRKVCGNLFWCEGGLLRRIEEGGEAG